MQWQFFIFKNIPFKHSDLLCWDLNAKAVVYTYNYSNGLDGLW